jgi:parallel beta-helix repeat protein
MEKIVVTVGESSGDLTGRANRVIQAAIDHVAFLGGGTVRIGEGVFQLENTLHLRSHVKLEGIPGKTVLRQGEERISALAADADLHERQITVEKPEFFPIGQTITVRKASASMGFADTGAIVVGKAGRVLYLDRQLHSTILLGDGGIATTQTAVISGYDCEQVEIRHLIVEGNKENRTFAEGCRNGGIYLFAAHHVLIEGCTVRNYNGDGISYQHGSNILVEGCDSVQNEGKGIHPGSGTTHTKIRNSRFDENGMDGIFFCWRVQDSVVEHCTATGNGMSGLSIGHKDIRNMIRNNRLSENRFYGIFFRNESEPMSASYNRVEGNIIEDNGSDQMGYVGVRIRGYTHDVELVSNRITFTKVPLERTVGICLEENTREITMENNEFENCALITHSHWLPEKY